MSIRQRRFTADIAIQRIWEGGDDGSEDELLVNLLDEEPISNFPIDDDAENADTVENYSDHDESIDERLLIAEDSEDSDNDDAQIDERSLIAPSGRQWHQFSRNGEGRPPRRNIYRQRSGVAPGIHPNSEKEAFLLYFDNIIDIVVRYTNLHARRVIANYSRESSLRKKWTPTDRVEMEAFIGLLIIAGATKAADRDTSSLWSVRDGLPVFRATMSRNRFLLLKRFLRFDNLVQRDPSDPLSPVRLRCQFMNCI